jgi:hypothetical protein
VIPLRSRPVQITLAQIHALGLEWPADLDPAADGTIDLAAAEARLAQDTRAAENLYYASIGKPGLDAARERFRSLEDQGHHVAGLSELARAIKRRSLGVGPVPRATLTALGLPCGDLLTRSLVAAGEEVDLVQTMLRLVRSFRHYDKEYDGLAEQRSRYGASKDDISDRWGELSTAIQNHRRAIRELGDILSAICR